MSSGRRLTFSVGDQLSVGRNGFPILVCFHLLFEEKILRFKIVVMNCNGAALARSCRLILFTLV